MEGKSKKESIPVILAIIGLIADVLGIYGAIKGNVSNGSLSNNTSILIISIIIIIYTWIAIAWFYILRAIKKNPSDIVIERTSIQTVTSIGIGLFSLYIALVFSIDIGYKAVLIWIYLLLFGLLPIGIGVFMKTNYSAASNEVEWSFFDNLGVSFFGFLIITGPVGYGYLSGQNGQYVCSFPFNGKQTCIKKGETVIALYDTNMHNVIVTDSLGNKDTVDNDIFGVHFEKKVGISRHNNDTSYKATQK